MLDNKGFAISIVLYSMSAVVVLVLMLIVAVNVSDVKNKNNMINEIKKEVSGF